MLEQLMKTIELLRQHVQKNLGLIHENERIVQEFLEEPVSESRSQKLKEKFQENKLLLVENNDFIKLQLYTIQLINKYRKTFTDFNTDEQIEEKITIDNQSKSESESQKVQELPASEEPKTYTKEEIFDLTISGHIQFDSLHPFIDDNVFFNELMEYFIKIEDYEMCKKLKNIKKEIEE